MNDLALHTTVRELVAAFVQAERDVRAAFAQIVAAEKSLNAVFALGDSHGRIRVTACGTSYRDNFERVEEAVEIMTREAWRAIVDRLDLRKFMSVKRWEQVQQELERGKLPAITEENVLRFAHDHLGQARSYLAESVHEVFEWLRPHGNTRAGKLKTNSELEVPAKVILDYMVELGWSSGFRIHYNRRQNLLALERVFRALDGRGEVQGYQSELETSIEASKDGTGETDLFRYRCCKNGALHLWFKSAAILDRFNALAGGARLRPAPSEEDRLREEITKARAENERLKKEKAA